MEATTCLGPLRGALESLSVLCAAVVAAVKAAARAVVRATAEPEKETNFEFAPLFVGATLC